MSQPTMTMNSTHFSDLAKEVQPPDKGILNQFNGGYPHDQCPATAQRRLSSS
jgi:hypothetical protein